MKMKKKTARILLVFAALALACVLCGTSASAATTCKSFIKIDGIDGNAGDTAHEMWIEVLSFDHAPAAVNNSNTEKSDFESFVFTHPIDKATPMLNKACASRQSISFAELDVCTLLAGRKLPSYNVKLENVRVIGSEIRTETLADGSSRLIEEVRLSATKQTWTVNTYSDTGELINTDTYSRDASGISSYASSTIDRGANVMTIVICAVFLAITAVAAVIYLNGQKKKA